MAQDEWTALAENRHGPAMLLLARQWAVDSSEAEDVSCRKRSCGFWRGRVRPPEDPAAYLYACVRNCALETRRGSAFDVRRAKKSAARPERVPDWFTSHPERAERNAGSSEC